jgi:hypothetical protein
MNFGKQISSQTKLKVNNIAAKATLEHGRETWVPSKRDKRLEVAQARFLRPLLGFTKLDLQMSIQGND